MCGIEIRRLQHPGVESDAFADIHFEEFGGGRDERSDSRAKCGVIFEHAGAIDARELDEIGDRREVRARVGVERPVRVGRDVVTMSAGGSGGTDAFGRVS